MAGIGAWNIRAWTGLPDAELPAAVETLRMIVRRTGDAIGFDAWVDGLGEGGEDGLDVTPIQPEV